MNGCRFAIGQNVATAVESASEKAQAETFVNTSHKRKRLDDAITRQSANFGSGVMVTSGRNFNASSNTVLTAAVDTSTAEDKKSQPARKKIKMTPNQFTRTEQRPGSLGISASDTRILAIETERRERTS